MWLPYKYGQAFDYLQAVRNVAALKTWPFFQQYGNPENISKLSETWQPCKYGELSDMWQHCKYVKTLRNMTLEV